MTHAQLCKQAPDFQQEPITHYGLLLSGRTLSVCTTAITVLVLVKPGLVCQSCSKLQSDGTEQWQHAQKTTLQLQIRTPMFLVGGADLGSEAHAEARVSFDAGAIGHTIPLCCIHLVQGQRSPVGLVKRYCCLDVFIIRY